MMMVITIMLVAILFDSPSGFSGQFQDMHPGAGSIRNVDVAAVIEFNVVGMDGMHRVAVPAGVGKRAAQSWRGPALRTTAGIVGRRNEISNRARIVRVANIENPHSADKPGDNRQLAVIRRVEQLRGSVGTEACTLIAEAVRVGGIIGRSQTCWINT